MCSRDRVGRPPALRPVPRQARQVREGGTERALRGCLGWRAGEACKVLEDGYCFELDSHWYEAQVELIQDACRAQPGTTQCAQPWLEPSGRQVSV